MCVLRQLSYDIRRDMLRTYGWLLLFLGFLWVDLLMFTNATQQFFGVDEVQIPRGCYYWKIYGGDYVSLGTGQSVHVSIEYLMFGILILLLSIGYPRTDFYGSGYRMMLACGSKRRWLIAKYLHALCKTAVCFLLCVVSVELAVLLARGKMMASSQVLYEEMLGYPQPAVGFTTTGVIAIGAASMLLSVFYVTLDVMIGSLCSVLVGSILLVASYFIDSPFLYGNQLMLVRMSEHMRGNQYEIWWLWWLLMIAIVSAVLGFAVIDKKDVLG